jgi:hypothetical protein
MNQRFVFVMALVSLTYFLVTPSELASATGFLLSYLAVVVMVLCFTQLNIVVNAIGRNESQVSNIDILIVGKLTKFPGQKCGCGCEKKGGGGGWGSM